MIKLVIKKNSLKKKELSLGIALLPIIILVLLLSYNVLIYGDDALGGSNQFILLIGGAIAGIIGFFYKVKYDTMLEKIAENLQSVTGALLILLFVGALAGTWLISGIIPAMIYYGLQILHPSIFLPACIVICAIISLATGSSWTTSATVGIALIGIGKVLGIPIGMVAGAVISGAYFGDKLSPLSDTTNLAPAMAGGELFSHIRYMSLTTIPSIVITLIVFLILSLTQETTGQADTLTLMAAIKEKFTINGWLFLVPATVILLIVKKSPPLIALLVGTLMGGIFALLFQSDILLEITQSRILTSEVAYRAIMDAISVSTEITTSNALLNDLFTSGGMEGMLGTIWLIICAMVFGAIMDAKRLVKYCPSVFDESLPNNKECSIWKPGTFLNLICSDIGHALVSKLLSNVSTRFVDAIINFVPFSGLLMMTSNASRSLDGTKLFVMRSKRKTSRQSCFGSTSSAISTTEASMLSATPRSTALDNSDCLSVSNFSMLSPRLNNWMMLSTCS